MAVKGHIGITTSDTVDIPKGPLRVVALTTGNVVLVDKYDTALTYTGVAAGTVLPVPAKRINATSTTATLAGILEN